MGLEEYLERGDETSLQGKLWMYGLCGKKLYAAYITNKPETILTETSSIIGTKNMQGTIESVESVAEQAGEKNGLFISPMYELENKTHLLETGTDLMNVGRFPKMKQLQEEIFSLSKIYSLVYTGQQEKKKIQQRQYNINQFMNEYLIPYLDAVTHNLKIEKPKAKQRLLDYAKTKNFPKQMKEDMQKITQVWENKQLDNKIRQAWVGMQVAFMNSYMKARTDEREYENTAKIKKERDDFAREHNI